MTVLRFLIVWMMLAWSAMAQPLHAQDVNTAPGTDDPATLLIEILRDEAALDALIAQLEARAIDPEAAPLAESPPPQQVSLARQIAEYTRAFAEGATDQAFDVFHSVQSMLAGFSDASRINWAEVSATVSALLIVGAITLGLFFGLRLLGGRIFAAMSGRVAEGRWLLMLALIAGSSVIDALIIVLAWAGGYIAALYLGEPGAMDFRQSLFLNAFLLVELTKVVLRGIFAPRFPRLRFAPMGDETAAYWYFWSSRLVSLLGYGILLVVPIINAAVSFAVGRSVTALIVITALLIAILIVLQNRAPVAQALRARHERMPEDMVGRIEAFFAGFWHWLAIGYLVALFVVWTVRPEEALPFMLMATLNSVIAVVAGVAVMALISRAITGGMRLPPDVRQTLPLLEDRLNAFVPTILKVLRILAFLAVMVVIAQVWQVMDFLGWAASEVGRDVTGRIVSATLVVLIALGVWLALSSFIEYRLNPEVGRVPTARERTLLALFRNAFTIALIIMAAMLALSQLGVNIAPLLAGAGVLGLAIGFGAQRLVQDIITGAFIQVENAMNEGDVVTAGGTTGVVEKLTIRSVGLRDLNGTYHLIPFSSVDMVSNFMKGFGFHVANVAVAYREDVAQVKDLMQEAFDILKATEHGESIVGDFEIHGVAELGESAVVVRGRIKTAPGMQWGVGRAYNEIIKQVLDRAGVEIPFPHMTLYMGQDKDGTAPPLHLRRAAPLPDRPAPTDPAAGAASEERPTEIRADAAEAQDAERAKP
ncbi:MAG: mechanosensitive ion channel [Rhodobacteraceae bacterium]|nr:mechanosensitive ion channel [Paracoccaceae bacterium]